jgi:hypothetical protein
MTITTCPKCGVRYCSKACQKTDWNKHKTECETYRKNRFTKKVTKMLTEKKYMVSCFWKGTACPMVLSSKESFNSYVEIGQNMVDLRLRMGLIKTEQIKDYTKQMDIMEQRLVDAEETTGITKDTLSREEQDMWWFYVGALIYLGLKEDNNFGYLENELNDEDTLFITL